MITFSEVPKILFLLSSTVLNGLFDKMYHTSATDRQCKAFSGLLVTFTLLYKWRQYIYLESDAFPERNVSLAERG